MVVTWLKFVFLSQLEMGSSLEFHRKKKILSGRARIGDLPPVEADVITTALRKPYKVAKSQTRVLVF